MQITVERVEYKEIEALHDLYRQEANCQIVHDATMRRGLADSYLIRVDGRLGGHGGVWNKYNPGRIMEFYVVPHLRAIALDMFRELITVSQATHMEAQTNMPFMHLLLLDSAQSIVSENILFQDTTLT